MTLERSPSLEKAKQQLKDSLARLEQVVEAKLDSMGSSDVDEERKALKARVLALSDENTRLEVQKKALERALADEQKRIDYLAERNVTTIARVDSLILQIRKVLEH